MKIIHYIGNYKCIIQKIEKAIKDSAFGFEKYDIQTLQPVDYLLIINPYKVGDYYYSISTLWQQYLKQNAPNTKLIVVGLNTNGYDNTSNYIHWLEFPNNIEERINNCLKVKNAPDLPKNKLCVIDRLALFFKGHDTESVIEKLNNWKISVRNINYSIEGKIDSTFEEVVEKIIPISGRQWTSFRNRWTRYLKFFDGSPFAKYENTIKDSITQITPFFKEIHTNTKNNFIEHKVLDNVENISQHLDKMKKYVKS